MKRLLLSPNIAHICRRASHGGHAGHGPTASFERRGSSIRSPDLIMSWVMLIVGLWAAEKGGTEHYGVGLRFLSA